MFLKLTKQNCKENQVLFLKENKEIECKDCPQDCAICYRSTGDNIECAYCDFGFYKDESGICKSCYKNCELCQGPELSQCEELQKYFYLDDKVEPAQVKKCSQEGCLFCSDNKCVQCDKKFYDVPIETNSFIDDQLFVECKKCTVDNCLICQNFQEFDQDPEVRCALCDQGYGLIEQKCQKCIENCQYCEESTDDCQLCEDTFIFDKKQKQCIKQEIENCLKIKNGKCKSCESHFTLDTENNLCLPCNKVVDKCNFCSKNKKNFICQNCIAGHFLNDLNQCQNCPENCLHCSSEKCLNCIQNHYYNEQEKKCMKCEIQNCYKCQSQDKCELCKDGFYLDSNQQCQQCKNNCLQCIKDGQNCLTCPVTHYLLEEEFVQQETQQSGMLEYFMGFVGLLINQPLVDTREWNTKSSCVKKCPQNIEGQKVSIDNLERKCVVKIEQSNPIVNLPKIQKKENVQNMIKQLLNKYQHEIEKQKSISLQKKDQTLSEECNYNGKLIYKITGQISYYVCICNKGYTGDNCEISQTLFQNVQKKLQEIIKNLRRSFYNYSKQQKESLLTTILYIKEFKFGRQVIEQVIQLIEDLIEKDKEIENFQSLYAIYDVLILQIYDLLEDQKKYQESLIFMSMDKEAEREMLLELMHSLFLKFFESVYNHKYEHSFLQNYQRDIRQYKTFSFQISEYKLKEIKNLDDLIVPTPNIDSAQNLKLPTKVQLNFEQQSQQQLVSHIQLVNLSAQLFQNYFQNMESVGLSNPLYFKILDPRNSQHQFKDVKIKSITIEFPLLFLPAQKDLQNILQCVGFDLYSKFEDVRGQLKIKEEGNIQRAQCLFEIDSNVNSSKMFFSIKINIRNQLNFQT